MHHRSHTVAIIGGGPAGLTAALEAARRGQVGILFESLPQFGGLARTERYRGYHFDIGGHRFFTKVPAVEELWNEVLGSDFLERDRLSRVFLEGQYYRYPIEPWEVMRKLGVGESILCAASYVRSHLAPRSPVRSVEDWLINHFGQRLYAKFFQTYTEKVWGIPCAEISADWAAQRIKGLSVLSILKDAFGLKRRNGAKSLIRSFQYPRLGPGMMWERAATLVAGAGFELRTNATVTELHWEPGRVTAAVVNGQRVEAEHFLSSMPIRDLIAALRPRVPELDAVAGHFRYRDFLTVALMAREPNPFPDNWIYVHDPEVRVGRIQNFNNWSPEMSPDPGVTCLVACAPMTFGKTGLEYFCSEGDDLWERSDAELMELARKEIGLLGLADPACVEDAAVVRAPKAYPVYNGDHEIGLQAVRDFLKQQAPNLQLMGRNGMHRYNNQDHSMVTAMLAVDNLFGAQHDLWAVNVDEEYHESGARLTRDQLQSMMKQQPPVPERARPATASS